MAVKRSRFHSRANDAAMKYIILLLLICLAQIVTCRKAPVPFQQKDPKVKYDNPGQIRDRERNQEKKAYTKFGFGLGMGPENEPEKAKYGLYRPSIMGEIWNSRFRQKFHPAWMDYCDPYHCNDYHKPACGLNRKQMKFKWFQSGCHIALHNFCHRYKGTIKYDTIEPKWCTKYVMFIRSGCQGLQDCGDENAPICGVSSIDNHVVLFKNRCFFEAANCNENTENEFEEVHMDICNFSLAYKSMPLKK